MFLVFLCLFTETTGYVLVHEMTFFIERFIRLCYMVIIFLICCHINNFICYDWVSRIRLVNSAVWCLNETILIDFCIGCKRVDQTDVRTLRSLDRAHTSIVRVVDISNLESGSVS